MTKTGEESVQIYIWFCLPFLSVRDNNQVIFILGKCIPEGADSHTVAEGGLLVNFSPQWVLFC